MDTPSWHTFWYGRGISKGVYQELDASLGLYSQDECSHLFLHFRFPSLRTSRSRRPWVGAKLHSQNGLLLNRTVRGVDQDSGASTTGIGDLSGAFGMLSLFLEMKTLENIIISFRISLQSSRGCLKGKQINTPMILQPNVAKGPPGFPPWTSI